MLSPFRFQLFDRLLSGRKPELARTYKRKGVSASVSLGSRAKDYLGFRAFEEMDSGSTFWLSFRLSTRGLTKSYSIHCQRPNF